MQNEIKEIIEKFLDSKLKEYQVTELEKKYFININSKDQIEVLNKYNILIKKVNKNIILENKKNITKKIDYNKKTGYVRPPFFDNIILDLKHANNYQKYKSKNLLFYGHKGTGKTTCVYELLQTGLFDKIYQQNGSNELTLRDFIGSKTIVIDEKTKQNKIVFDKGLLYKAFIHGTEVNEDGEQILYNGEPKVIGKPAIYFLDEFELIQPEVLTSVFNRALEIPIIPGIGRSLEIFEESKTIKSHPGFTIIFASNLLGKGIETNGQIGYTSQNNQHDDSTLDRINIAYEFGFNLEAESKIINNFIKDKKITTILIKFIEKMRYSWETSTVNTLISTRNIANMCELYEIYNDEKIENPIELSFINAIYNKLNYSEKDAWMIAFDLCFGTKLKSHFTNNITNKMRFVNKINEINI